MKRNWLAAFVGGLCWGLGGLLSASGAAPLRASDPAYYVCPYLAEDFHGSYSYGADWYLLGPESEGAKDYLAALERAGAIAEADDSPVADLAEANEEPKNCLIDKSTGESYARYLVEQVYRLYFAEKDRSPAKEAIVADPVDDALLCPAEQDYLDWRLDRWAGDDEMSFENEQDYFDWLAESADPVPSDEELEAALAAESSYEPELGIEADSDPIELVGEPQPEYDWEAFEYIWNGADDPAFADADGQFLLEETASDDESLAAANESAEADYAEAERLSAFEEYALWEETYGQCAEAADRWAAIQDAEDDYAHYWDDVIISGAKWIPAERVAAIVMNGTPSACTPTVPATLVRNEDFAAPGQYVPMEREEDSYPLAILEASQDRLGLSAERLADIAAARAVDRTGGSPLAAATAPLRSFGESARRAIRDLALSADERAALRTIAAGSGRSNLR